MPASAAGADGAAPGVWADWASAATGAESSAATAKAISQFEEIIVIERLRSGLLHKAAPTMAAPALPP